MATFDGDINHVGDDVVAGDAERAKKFLSTLDPVDDMQKQDGAKFKAMVKKIIADNTDPQDAEDGKRIIAALKKLFGADEPIDETAAIDKPALPMPGAVVDTGVLTGPRDGLKSFLIDKQRSKEQE